MVRGPLALGGSTRVETRESNSCPSRRTSMPWTDGVLFGFSPNRARRGSTKCASHVGSRCGVVDLGAVGKWPRFSKLRANTRVSTSARMLALSRSSSSAAGSTASCAYLQRSFKPVGESADTTACAAARRGDSPAAAFALGAVGTRALSCKSAAAPTGDTTAAVLAPGTVGTRAVPSKSSTVPAAVSPPAATVGVEGLAAAPAPAPPAGVGLHAAPSAMAPLPRMPAVPAAPGAVCPKATPMAADLGEPTPGAASGGAPTTAAAALIPAEGCVVACVAARGAGRDVTGPARVPTAPAMRAEQAAVPASPGPLASEDALAPPASIGHAAPPAPPLAPNPSKEAIPRAANVRRHAGEWSVAAAAFAAAASCASLLSFTRKL
mmetsp:Transcript_7619/g.20825  ORF Transcript_7619/g.20825 Transcript_7619/m.20825 type:complete len:379 (-) Transcript_7619:488-1624(-)